MALDESAALVFCLEVSMQRIRVVERPQREVIPSPPSVSVRICKGCGNHYVGLLKWKAEAEALRLIGSELPEDRTKIKELTQEAHVSLFSSRGWCRACSLDRCSTWGIL